MVSIVIGGSGELARSLACVYREAGAEVLEVDFEDELVHQLSQVPAQVDLLVIADDFDPPAGAVAGLSRNMLAHAMHRLSFMPFRLAALLQPGLAAAGGSAVLLTCADARMDVVDSAGRYAERPFRTAAHALWRCMSVEWQDAGIHIGLIGLDSFSPDLKLLMTSIAHTANAKGAVELEDIAGKTLGW